MKPHELDPNAMEKLRKLGGEALVRRMIDLFVDEGKKRMESAHSSLATGDLKTLERVGHSLKSSAANVGAMGLSELSGRLEEAAGRGRRDELSGIVGEIEAVLATVSRRLEELRPSA